MYLLSDNNIKATVLQFMLWRAELKLCDLLYLATDQGIRVVVTFIKEHTGVILKRNVWL